MAGTVVPGPLAADVVDLERTGVVHLGELRRREVDDRLGLGRVTLAGSVDAMVAGGSAAPWTASFQDTPFCD